MAITYRVTTPEQGYNGASVGVTFVSGVAENVPDGAALRYFRRAGYGVEEMSAARPAQVAESAADGAEPDNDDGPVKPAGNASTDAWRAHAVAVGKLTAEEAESMSRDEIKAKFSDDKESEVPS